MNLRCFVGRIRRSRRIRHQQAHLLDNLWPDGITHLAFKLLQITVPVLPSIPSFALLNTVTVLHDLRESEQTRRQLPL